LQYLGEVAPARSRGRIVELYELMLCFGMLAASLMDAALENVPGNWRLMVGIPVLPSILMTSEPPSLSYPFLGHAGMIF